MLVFIPIKLLEIIVAVMLMAASSLVGYFGMVIWLEAINKLCKIIGVHREFCSWLVNRRRFEKWQRNTKEIQ